MSRIAGALLVACLLGEPLAAQEEALTSEQLRRMYDDAVAQLRSVQDRRNELARENERLRQQVSRLDGEAEALRHQYQQLADATWRIRSERAAWLSFLRTRPLLHTQWLSFLQDKRLMRDPAQWLDPDWPLPRLDR